MNKIEYKWVDVRLGKGESRSEWFKLINPLMKVPAMKTTTGCLMNESLSIMKYLSREYKVDVHWYP